MHGHEHEHTHDHHLRHGHSHLPPGTDGRPVTWRGLLAVGISGGLLPCPSALVLMLGAISLNRIGFGLLLIVAFSIGLAGVLTLFGIALVHAGKWFERIPEGGRLIRFVPAASALFITAAGLVITAAGAGPGLSPRRPAARLMVSQGSARGPRDLGSDAGKSHVGVELNGVS